MTWFLAILVVVVMFSGFPPAFAAVSIARFASPEATPTSREQSSAALRSVP